MSYKSENPRHKDDPNKVTVERYEGNILLEFSIFLEITLTVSFCPLPPFVFGKVLKKETNRISLRMKGDIYPTPPRSLVGGFL